jgi:hypothetical protein
MNMYLSPYFFVKEIMLPFYQCKVYLWLDQDDYTHYKGVCCGHPITFTPLSKNYPIYLVDGIFVSQLGTADFTTLFKDVIPLPVTDDDFDSEGNIDASVLERIASIHEETRKSSLADYYASLSPEELKELQDETEASAFCDGFPSDEL